MAAPVLSGTIAGTSTTFSYNLAIVTTIVTTKNSGLIILPYSRQDSPNTVTFDLSGPTRTIKILGHFVGISTILASQKKNFENLMVGVQDSPYTFTSDLSGGGIKVKIMDMTFIEPEGLTNQIDYELNLVESAE